MNGMLADINIQGHLPYVRRLLVQSGLMPLLDDTNLRLVTFPELGLDRRIDDRPLWNVCQQGDGYYSPRTETRTALIRSRPRSRILGR